MFVDLHTHTSLSDGVLKPMELLTRAHEAGIRILALTDHNDTQDLAGYRAAFPDMTLIQGAEITCLHRDSAGKSHEIHLVALGFDPEHAQLQAMLRANRPDRRPYINAILEKLGALGIDVGTYDDLQAANPDSNHFGRMQIAEEMVNRGYVATIDEGFDTYLGAHGQRLAYVANPLTYVQLEDAIDTVLAAGGIPVLAHLYYYLMSDADHRILVRTVAERSRGRGGMETEYAPYTPQQRAQLRSIADEYGLMHSCASDYHGKMVGETLAHGFRVDECRPLLEALGVV